MRPTTDAPPPPAKTVILLDDDRAEETRVEILARDFGYLITVDGTRYHHVSTADDGTWRYVKG